MLARRRARTGLLDFTTYTKPDYQVNWHHEVLCSHLDRVVSGEIRRLMVFAPPQHGKTEVVSKRLPAYIFGRDPDASVIACSYGFNLAQENNRSTQRIIDTDAYRRVFPGTQLFGKSVRNQVEAAYLRNSEVFEIVDHKGSYRCGGAGGSITGHGATYGIIDDPIKSDEAAYSPTVRANLANWYRGTFYTRLRKDARVIIVLTRWHKNDLAGSLLREAEDNPKADKWHVVSFEGERTDRECEYDPRSPGEPLWPEFKSTTELTTIKTTLGPVRWAAMYQQVPRAEGGSAWPESFFEPDIWFNEWPQECFRKSAAWDPSKGTGTKWGDYSAFVKVMLGRDGIFYVDAELTNDRPLNVGVDTVVEIQRTFQPQYFGVEVNQFQQLLVDDINQASAVAGVPVPIYELDNRVNKEVRIHRLTPYLSQKHLRFKGGSPGVRLLVEQMQEFPNCDHDDGPDALEMAIRLLEENCGGHDDGLGGNLLDAVGATY